MVVQDMIIKAEEVLTKSSNPMDFSTLYNKVCSVMKIVEPTKSDLISDFYTELTLNGSFMCIDKKWDLRVRNKVDAYAATVQVEEDSDDDSSIDNTEIETEVEEYSDSDEN